MRIVGILIGMCAVFYSSIAYGSDTFTVADIFGDNMVLQAHKPINVWGAGRAGTEVTVRFRSQNKSVIIAENGFWELVLDPEGYGGPDKLVVTSTTNNIEFQNIMVGEVWICSGQSNMEMPMISNWAHLNNAEQEVRAAEYPGIRLYTVPRKISFQPIHNVFDGRGWQVCDTTTVKYFSATAYFFGREIHTKLGVPVGLLHASWGGTVAQAWVSKNSLLKLADFAGHAELLSRQTDPMDSLLARYERDIIRRDREIAELDVGIEGDDTVFVSREVDTSTWLTFDLPGFWEGTELGSFDGSAWFIKKVELSADLTESALTLCFGAPDDWDEAWFNGVKVGASKAWDVQREYDIPEGLARPGENTIVIRVMDNQGAGGFMQEEDDFMLRVSGGEHIPIAKGWKAKKGFDFQDVTIKPVSPDNPNQPTVLFNAMINPLIPYTMRGVIWYQGESNAGMAYQYRGLFKTLIKDWRTHWGQGDFPFLFVQLANYLQKNTEPVEDTWAELREAQAMALELPNTGMAVTIDIGDALDIHPGNKQDVGKRLALNALARVYKKDIPYSGPVYKKMKIKRDKILLYFDHVLDGLKSSDGGPLKGFAIAGPDKKFVWGEASIRGNKVVVSAPGIHNPAAVRYGWSSNPDCNLVNSAGLPASPFRTDNWRGITEPDRL